MWDKPQALMQLANFLTAIAVVMFFYAAIWLVVNSSLFPLRQVEVRGGLAHVTPQQLEYVAQNELKGTFFTLDIAGIRDAFNALPWVKEVTVYRRWPDRLEVQLTEHQALARWGTGALLDREGERFEAPYSGALPTLEGPDGSEQEMVDTYMRFKDILAPTGKVLTHIWLSPRRAWKIGLNDGTTVEIGRDYVSERLTRFVGVYREAMSKLRNQKVEYVDLRYANGFAVQLPHYQPAGRDT